MPGTGKLNLSLESVRSTLAGSASFRTWAGVSDEAGALAHIHVVATPGAWTRPAALVSYDPEFRMEAIAGGARLHSDTAQFVYLRLEKDTPEAFTDDPEGAGLLFASEIGPIILDLEAAAGTGGALAIHEISMALPPQRVEFVEETAAVDYWQAVFRMGAL